jgi:hypothetical protein
MRVRIAAQSLLALLAYPALVAEVTASSPQSLYVLSAQATVAADGKPLTMTIRETKRAPDFSLVDVEYVSGGSASSLFLVRGLCGLMQAREQKLAVAEQVSEHPVQFRMTFPTSAKVEDTKGLPRMVLSASDCTPFQGRHE